MRIVAEAHDPKLLSVDLLFIPLSPTGRKLPANAAPLDKAAGGLLSDLIEQERLEGKDGEHASLRMHGKLAATKVCLLGTGTKPLGAAAARKLAARAASLARSGRAKTYAILLPDALGAPPVRLAAALAEGALLGDYRFLKYKKDDLKRYQDHTPATLSLCCARKDASAVEKGIRRGEIYSRATTLARELVNEPASEMTPDRLVAEAERIAKSDPKRLTLKVFGEKELKKMGAGGILGIAKGSDEPAYMVHLTYAPSKAKKKRKKVVIVGKGITFDSGGLSLKPSEAMEDMKIDMGGCAAMLGVMSALSALAPDVEVHGISGICENMPSGKAVKPGDVVRTMNGKTIEILNTDAEGRVTLADTLHYGSTLAPDHLIDMATLTGACMVALGQEVAGMMANDKKLSARLLEAAANGGELLWQLPLTDEYRPLMKSRVADLKNISGTRYGGAITAGLFLEEFVGKASWAHLDIAGPAWAEKDTVPHQPLGATGFGVRTMLYFLESL